MKFLSPIFVLLLAAASQAHAQLANLPDFVAPQVIGRVTLYASVQPLSWLQPTAFESEMSCTGTDASAHRTCSIKIFNRLSNNEQSELDRLTRELGLNVVALSDIDNRVVGGITESFTGLPQDVGAQTQSMRTLRLSDSKFPYGSVMFRAEGGRASDLLQQYTSSGLGSFKVSFQVHGQKTETYLGLRDGACVKSKLQDMRGRTVPFREINRLLDGVMRDCQVRALGYADDEISVYLRVQLRETLFSGNWSDGYQVKTDAVEKLGETYVIARAAGPETTLNCQTELKLQQSAVAVTTCQ